MRECFIKEMFYESDDYERNYFSKTFYESFSFAIERHIKDTLYSWSLLIMTCMLEGSYSCHILTLT